MEFLGMTNIAFPNSNCTRRSAIHGVALFTALFALTAPSARAGEDLLIPAKGKDGKPSPLFQKVVVTSDEAGICRATPGDKDAEPVEPYSIFYKLKTPSGGEEQDGWVRIGTSKGEHIGWIQRKNKKGEPVVMDWSTRFVLEPNVPTPERAFRVKRHTDGEILELKNVPEGRRRFAFITKSGDNRTDDSGYEVFVCTAKVQSEKGAMKREAKKLQNTKLELAFVIESTDFLLNTFDGVRVGDAIKDVMRGCIAEIENDDELKGAVRLGLVEFQDTSPKASFPKPRISCNLTADMGKVKTAIEQMQPTVIEGDFPEDTLGGLRTALDELAWDPLSVKHIVLMGFAAAQLYPKGKSPGNLPGHDNKILRKWGPPEERGWNSSGLSIDDLLRRANPEARTDDDKARARKVFHTVWIGKDARQTAVDQGLQPKSVEFVTAAVEPIIKASDQTIDDIFEAVAGKLLDIFDQNVEVAKFAIFKGLQIRAFEENEKYATSQYRQLAANMSTIDGIYEKIPPQRTELERVSKTLKDSLAQGFNVLSDVRGGDIQDEGVVKGRGAFAESFYAIIGANKDKQPPQATEQGEARTHADDGREVAKRKVMVGRNELQKLRGLLSGIHGTFSKKVAKKDRQSVNDTLDELKRAIAGAAAGQVIASTQLQDVITDLPLTTDVLRITPEQIATFSSDKFKAWLDAVQRSIQRCQDRLDESEWLPLSDLAQADEVSFLLLTELP
jgi:hypothetical protein